MTNLITERMKDTVRKIAAHLREIAVNTANITLIDTGFVHGPKKYENRVQMVEAVDKAEEGIAADLEKFCEKHRR